MPVIPKIIRPRIMSIIKESFEMQI